MAVSDEELMQSAQAGQVSAFEELVRRYRGPLLRVARSKLGDPVLAEDVVQDGLLAAYASRQTFNARASFRTWMWTIVLRLCGRQGRRALTARASGGSTGAVDPVLTQPTGNGLDALLRAEQSQLVHEALRELPEAQADAIRLRFFGGLAYDEIATAMESSVSGAKQRVRLGLERLAERLKVLAGSES